MSTILHPCLESQFKETAKLVKLKVAAPPLPKSIEFEKNRGDEFNHLKMKNISSSSSSNTTEHGGWTFLQAITTNTSPMEEKENSSIYIQPLSYKYASSRLSEKSLQLCTENLGCETGSFWMDTNILSLTTTYNYSMDFKQEQKQMQGVAEAEAEGEGYSFSSSKKKVKVSRELPPPLTTMSGGNSIQVKTHREDGRLIIKAIEKPLKESCFIADRSEGRLKLCFLKDVFTKVDMKQQQQMSPEGGNEAEKELADIKNEKEMMMKDDDPGENEDYSENQENKEDYKEIMVMSKEYIGVGKNNINNNNDVEKEKYQRFGRCKECKKKMCNWEPFWVATS